VSDSDDAPGSDSDQVIERDQTYTHSEHGQVTVTGIWKGVDEVDKAHHSDEKDIFIVRYSAEINGEEVDGLVDPLDEFIQAIE